MLTIAGVEVSIEQVRATKRLLDYYRRFLASSCERCADPEDRYFVSGDFAFRNTMSKDEVRRRVGFLVNTAINRKAGIPDIVCRKQDPDYQIELWRDCREIRDHRTRRLRLWGLNGRRFRTDIIQRRYGHLLSDPD